jgi:Ca2+:H+ antiporter
VTPATRASWRLRPAVAGSAAVFAAGSLDARASSHPHATFVLSGLAVVPLSAMLGRATAELAAHTGPRVGGLVNATLGNAAEVIIGVLLVTRGELDVVQASLTGSVLANLLLVLGTSFLVAGVRQSRVRFSSRAASALVASTGLAVAGMLLPSIYAHHADLASDFRRETISIGVAVVLVLLYLATLAYMLVTHRDVLRRVESDDAHPPPAWSVRASVLTLVATAVVIAVESHLLVDALDLTLRSWHVSQTWAGLVLIAVIGNAAEHSSAVMMAWRGRVDVAIDIAVGSSAQIALLATPVLVFTGALTGHHLQLTFTSFELGAMAIAVSAVALLVLDGESDWLEGAQLVALYVIVAISAFFIGKT